MEKRGVIAILAFLFAMNFILAATCTLTTQLINQDPYPAIPGDYVKLVFQVKGVENPECGKVTVDLKETFPFSLEPGQTNPVTITSGTFERSYNSFLILPYKIRVDENALDGDTPIEILTKREGFTFLNNFTINIDDTRSDFEVFIKDYKPLTKIMTLEILNTGKNNVRALTIEIPKQKHIEVKGANRNIVGDLDSNEYSTADFEIASAGGDIQLNLYYTDSISIRRNINKTITFDSGYFENRASDAKSSSSMYIIIGVVIIIIAIIIFRRYKRRKVR
jgi:hypothetical protein